MDDSHLDYKQKFLKNTLDFSIYPVCALINNHNIINNGSGDNGKETSRMVNHV
jgi:hypothetical protein